MSSTSAVGPFTHALSIAIVLAALARITAANLPTYATLLALGSRCRMAFCMFAGGYGSFLFGRDYHPIEHRRAANQPSITLAKIDVMVGSG
jgi:hypothetical protein